MPRCTENLFLPSVYLSAKDPEQWALTNPLVSERPQSWLKHYLHISSYPEVLLAPR